MKVTSRLVRKREQLSGCLIFPISITTFSLSPPLLSFRVKRSSRLNTGNNCPPGDISGILYSVSEVASFYLPIWEFCQSPFLLNEFNQWALCFWKLESFSMNILSFHELKNFPRGYFHSNAYHLSQILFVLPWTRFVCVIVTVWDCWCRQVRVGAGREMFACWVPRLDWSPSQTPSSQCLGLARPGLEMSTGGGGGSSETQRKM